MSFDTNPMDDQLPDQEEYEQWEEERDLLSNLPELTDGERKAMESIDLTEVLGTWEERHNVVMEGAKKLLRDRTELKKENERLRDEIEQLKDLLASARVITQRRGEGTAWERFDSRLESAGISSVTAKTFRVLPSDLEELGTKDKG
jgi:hypothetical protein